VTVIKRNEISNYFRLLLTHTIYNLVETNRTDKAWPSAPH